MTDIQVLGSPKEERALTINQFLIVTRTTFSLDLLFDSCPFQEVSFLFLHRSLDHREANKVGPL